MTETTNTKKKDWKYFLYDMATGGTAASVAKTIVAPLERVKLLNQTSSAGLLKTLINIPKEEGFPAYWRGNWANVVRYFPTQALNFAFKDKIKDIVMPLGQDKYSKTEQFLRGLVYGGVAGAASLSFVYPLDLARTRMTTDVGKHGETQYKGLFDTCKKTYAEGGIRSLYRGFNVSVVGIIGYRGFYFGGYDTLKQTFIPDGNGSFWLKWGIAQVNTIVAETVVYPIDTVRRILMLSGKIGKDGKVNRTYKNAWECFKVVYSERGIRGFFHGTLANVYRATGGALCMVFYDTMREQFGFQEVNKDHKK